MRFNTSFWKCFFLLLPFFEPQYFKTLGTVNRFYQLAVYIAVVYIIFEYVVQRRIPSKIVLTIVALELWTIVITFINKGPVTTAVNYLLTFGAVAAIIDLYSGNILKLLNCLLIHFEICIYINAVSLFLMPNGLYSIVNSVYGLSPGYFLGWHHLFLVWFFPGLLVAWCYKEISGKVLRCYLLSAIIILSELKFGGSTGILGCTLFLLPNIIKFMRNFVKKYITPYKGIAITALVVLLIVYFRSYGFLKPIIVNVLGGDMTFTGRLDIWDRAIDAISRNLVFGSGVLSQSKAVKLFGFGAATHCHNHILQILYQGGLIGFALFVALYVMNLKQCKQNWHSGCAQICTWAIIVYTVIGITEQREYALMYLALILPYYVNRERITKLRSMERFL